MSVKLMSKVWDSPYARKTPARMLVMLCLADHSNDEGECYPSQARIADKSGLARETVNRVILELENDEVVEIVRDRGIFNRYRLHFFDLPTCDEKSQVTCDEKSQGGVTRGHRGSDERSHVPVTRGHTNHHRTINEPKNTVDEVYDFWKTTFTLNGSAKLTTKRRQKIKDRLREGYDIERIKNAILGNSISPYHCGQNDQKRKYHDIELICRSGEKLEGFEALWLDSQESGDVAKREAEQTAAEYDRIAQEMVRKSMEAAQYVG